MSSYRLNDPAPRAAAPSRSDFPNAGCPKRTFAEQVEGPTVRYQRRTPLLQQVVEAVGVLLAGRGGARMLRVIDVAPSRCTVLSVRRSAVDMPEEWARYQWVFTTPDQGPRLAGTAVVRLRRSLIDQVIVFAGEIERSAS
ncbi:hypothetical protein [Streptomyces sp. NPDC048442]|uniref:hypothetical protein n=1 Tax=Streptomyces sp. NPDC048442 TaxID=3154823 RepID=UPI003413C1A4